MCPGGGHVVRWDSVEELSLEVTPKNEVAFARNLGGKRGL